MNKKQKEMGLKKIEIENLKIKEGIFRTLSIIINSWSRNRFYNFNGKIYEYMLYLLLFTFCAYI